MNRKARKPNPKTEARKAEIEIAVKGIDDDSPDFEMFMRRWSGRYNENNLRRLWVQAPNATCLHRFGTWRGMGRQVRRGQTAILLMQPHVRFDPEKITSANPEGKVFTGANWMALFDYAQTEPIGEFTEGPDLDAGTAENLKDLKRAANAVHPDNGGTAEQFTAAWLRYEQARNDAGIGKPRQDSFTSPGSK